MIPTESWPEGVAYPTWCGALCKGLRRQNMFNQLQSLMAELAAKSHRSKKPKFVSQKGLFLAVASCDRGVTFARMSEAKDKYGRWPASQMFTLLERVAGEDQPPFMNLILRVARSPHIQPYATCKFRLPVAACDGCMVVESEGNFLKRFLCCTHVVVHTLNCKLSGNSSSADQWCVLSTQSQHEVFAKESDADVVRADVAEVPADDESDDDIAGGVDVADPSSLFSTGPDPVVPAPIQGGLDADPDHVDLERELELLMDADDEVAGSQAAAIGEVEIALDMLDEEIEVPPDSAEAVPIVEPHDGASSSAAGPACEHEEGFDNFIRDLDLVDMSTGGKWVYRHTGDANKLFTVHKIAKGSSGYDTMKATCHLHPKCNCWISKGVCGEQRIPLLQDLIEWGSSGRVLSEDEHWRAARELKLKYGMKVK